MRIHCTNLLCFKIQFWDMGIHRHYHSTSSTFLTLDVAVLERFFYFSVASRYPPPWQKCWPFFLFHDSSLFQGKPWISTSTINISLLCLGLTISQESYVWSLSGNSSRIAFAVDLFVIAHHKRSNRTTRQVQHKLHSHSPMWFSST